MDLGFQELFGVSLPKNRANSSSQIQKQEPQVDEVADTTRNDSPQHQHKSFDNHHSFSIPLDVKNENLKKRKKFTPSHAAIPVAIPVAVPENSATNVHSDLPKGPGRPATYIFDKADDQLTENERKLKRAILKRRIRQNRSYHKRKGVAANTSDKPHPDNEDRDHRNENNNKKNNNNNNEKKEKKEKKNSKSNHERVPKDTTTTTIKHESKNIKNLVQPSNTVKGEPSIPSPPFPFPNLQSVVPHEHYTSEIEFIQNSTQDLKSLLPVEYFSSVISAYNTNGKSNKIKNYDENNSNENERSLVLANTVPSKILWVQSSDLSPKFAKENQNLNSRESLEDQELDTIDPEDIQAPDDILENASSSRIGEFNQLYRTAGLKDIIFSNVAVNYYRLSLPCRLALQKLSIFPCSFDLNAAKSILGPNVITGLKTALDWNSDSNLTAVNASALPIDMFTQNIPDHAFIPGTRRNSPTDDLSAVFCLLEPLFSSSFLYVSNGRLQLNNIARSYIVENIAQSEDPSFLNDAQNRYIDHYTSILRDLAGDNLHKYGWVREHAMEIYDMDIHNIENAYFLASQQSKSRVQSLLVAAASVMRYCVNSSSRIYYFKEALEPDSSTFFTHPSITESLTQARLQLALGEAYLDSQIIQETKVPLLRAMQLYSNIISLPGPVQSSQQTAHYDTFRARTDSVIVFLLVANLYMQSSRFDEAQQYLTRALHILHTAGMVKTTLAVNALLNLCIIYLQKGDFIKAQKVSIKLLDVLHGMKYHKMPIYADALGVTAMLSLALKNSDEGFKQFSHAIDIVTNWGSNDKWTVNIPIQHCLDLDIWLMEGYAKAAAVQHRIEEAKQMIRLAQEARKYRGLGHLGSITEEDLLDTIITESFVKNFFLSVRHVY